MVIFAAVIALVASRAIAQRTPADTSAPVALPTASSDYVRDDFGTGWKDRPTRAAMRATMFSDEI